MLLVFVDTNTDENSNLLKNGEFHYDNFLKLIVFPLRGRHINLALITFDQYQCLSKGINKKLIKGIGIFLRLVLMIKC